MRPPSQVEVHPYYSQPALRAIHEQRGIVTQAWSPLGGVYVYRGPAGDEPKNALEDPVISAIAERHGKTPAQVVLPGTSTADARPSRSP